MTMPTMEEFMEELEAAIENRRLRNQNTMSEGTELVEPKAANRNRRFRYFRCQGCISRNKTLLVFLAAFAIVVSCFIYIVYSQTKANSPADRGVYVLMGVTPVTAVFTRNGRKVGERVLRFNRNFQLFAAVGMHSSGEKVKVILDAKKP